MVTLGDRKEALEAEFGRDATPPVRPRDEEPEESRGLGLTLENLDARTREQLGLDQDQDGVVVTRVDFESEADDKGLRPTMVITAVNDEPIESVREWEQCHGRVAVGLAGQAGHRVSRGRAVRVCLSAGSGVKGTGPWSSLCSAAPGRLDLHPAALQNEDLTRCSSSAKPQILVVDDEQDIRSSLQRILEYEGMVFTEAASGSEALERVAAFDPDAVLLDIKMPRMDGLEVLAELRKRKPELPVVMISGHGTIGTAVEATKLGAFDFMEKPLETRARVARAAKCFAAAATQRGKPRSAAGLRRAAPDGRAISGARGAAGRDRALRADQGLGADHRRVGNG